MLLRVYQALQLIVPMKHSVRRVQPYLYRTSHEIQSLPWLLLIAASMGWDVAGSRRGGVVPIGRSGA